MRKSAITGVKLKKAFHIFIFIFSLNAITSEADDQYSIIPLDENARLALSESGYEADLQNNSQEKAHVIKVKNAEKYIKSATGMEGVALKLFMIECQFTSKSFFRRKYLGVPNALKVRSEVLKIMSLTQLEENE